MCAWQDVNEALGQCLAFATSAQCPTQSKPVFRPGKGAEPPQRKPSARTAPSSPAVRDGAIVSAEANSTNTSAASESLSDSKGISSAALAGAVLAGTFAVGAALVLLVLLIIRRRRRQRQHISSSPGSEGKPSLSGKPQLAGSSRVQTQYNSSFQSDRCSAGHRQSLGDIGGSTAGHTLSTEQLSRTGVCHMVPGLMTQRAGCFAFPFCQACRPSCNIARLYTAAALIRQVPQGQLAIAPAANRLCHTCCSVYRHHWLISSQDAVATAPPRGHADTAHRAHKRDRHGSHFLDLHGPAVNTERARGQGKATHGIAELGTGAAAAGEPASDVHAMQHMCMLMPCWHICAQHSAMFVCARVLHKRFGLHPDAQISETQVFAGRYVLLAEMVEGGQAIVNFARDQGSGSFQYAIKCGSAATVSLSQAAAPSRLPLLNTFAALGT